VQYSAVRSTEDKTPRTDKVQTRPTVRAHVSGNEVDPVRGATEHGVESARPDLSVWRELVGHLRKKVSLVHRKNEES
jgi:hypothetical protein